MKPKTSISDQPEPATDIFQIRRSRIVAILGLIICCFIAYICLDFKFFNQMHWKKSLDRHSMLVWGILGIDLFCIATTIRNAANPDVVLRVSRDGVEIGGSVGSVQLIPWSEVVEFKEISIGDMTATTQNRPHLPALQIIFSNSIDLGRFGWPLAYPKDNTFIVASTCLPTSLPNAIARLNAMRDQAVN